MRGRSTIPATGSAKSAFLYKEHLQLARMQPPVIPPSCKTTEQQSLGRIWLLLYRQHRLLLLEGKEANTFPIRRDSISPETLPQQPQGLKEQACSLKAQYCSLLVGTRPRFCKSSSLARHPQSQVCRKLAPEPTKWSVRLWEGQRTKIMSPSISHCLAGKAREPSGLTT